MHTAAVGGFSRQFDWSSARTPVLDGRPAYAHVGVCRGVFGDDCFDDIWAIRHQMAGSKCRRISALVGGSFGLHPQDPALIIFLLSSPIPAQYLHKL